MEFSSSTHFLALRLTVACYIYVSLVHSVSLSCHFPPGPAKPPENVRGHNLSSTSIRVDWDAVPFEDQNGVIHGYRVRYNKSGEGEEENVVSSGTTNKTLINLNEFTVYNICVLAFTAKGNGPQNCTIVYTAEDSKFLSH